MSDIRKIEIASAAASRVEPKKEKESQETPFAEGVGTSTRWLLLHLDVLKKICKLFPKESTEDSSLFMRKNLKKFFVSLKELASADLSHDTDFLLKLSHHWNQFLEYFSLWTFSGSEEESRLQAFFSAINDYPRGERYSLGYYLSEAAGEKWIPFPFMTLLHDLYEEHQAEREKSTLSHWIDLLEGYFKQF